MQDKKVNIWADAGVPGLVLGGISIAYLLINSYTTGLTGKGFAAFLIGTLNFLLWAGKLALCIWLLRSYILHFSEQNPSEDRRRVLGFGVAAAFLSALLYSVFYLAYVLYINPEAISASFDAVMQQYSSMMDPATVEAMENLRSDMPVATFFTNLIWCFLFGTILSAIFSRNIGPDSDNPFKDEQ